MKRALKIGAILLGALFLFAIIALLPALRDAQTQARMAKTRLKLICIQSACSNYFDTYGQWPGSISSLFGEGNSNKIVFLAPEHATNDGWDRLFIYEPFDTLRGYGRALSYGRDGRAGGNGADADMEVRFGK